MHPELSILFSWKPTIGVRKPVIRCWLDRTLLAHTHFWEETVPEPAAKEDDLEEQLVSIHPFLTFPTVE